MCRHRPIQRPNQSYAETAGLNPLDRRWKFLEHGSRSIPRQSRIQGAARSLFKASTALAHWLHDHTNGPFAADARLRPMGLTLARISSKVKITMKLAKDSTGSAERYSPPPHDFELLNKRCRVSPEFRRAASEIMLCWPGRPNRDPGVPQQRRYSFDFDVMVLRMANELERESHLHGFSACFARHEQLPEPCLSPPASFSMIVSSSLARSYLGT